jgi:hypothetical protein
MNSKTKKLDLIDQLYDRFKETADVYARRVMQAYNGDIRRAAMESDAQVAETVKAWETKQGITPSTWPVISNKARSELRDRRGRLLQKGSLEASLDRYFATERLIDRARRNGSAVARAFGQ